MRLLNSITLLLLAVLTACSGIDTDELTFADGRYIYTMNVEGGKTDYDGQSRAAKTWSSGDKLYVRFSGNVTTTGVATYSGGTWTLAVDKQLTGSGSLTAVEIDGSTSVSGNTVTMSAENAVYRCDNGTWNQSGTTLNVNINVKPVFGRLRFKGTSGTSFSLNGMTTYSAYNISTGQFTETTSAVSGTIASAGYSPYLYGRLSSQTLSTNGYTMECPTTMLRAGSSGWLNYPTASSHSGWSGGSSSSDKLEFTVDGVKFSMILVEHGTFTMGATPEPENPYDSEKPAHQVTISQDYYIGETEVTQALWQAVTGYVPTTNGSHWSSNNGLGDNYPAYNISYDDVQDFITKLNAKTGKTFRMPTEAEWEYAARGGKKSKGYQYSGSNTIGDVAWYTDNSSSETHQVKTKAANELGIYDMSGNVYEWCSDWYGSYSSSSVTDPTGPTSGSHRVYRGGSWCNRAGDCRVASRNLNSPSYRNGHLGVRLALSSSQNTPSGGGSTSGHEYVDLGLSVKWATCNVGASKPEDYGDYYAWGEVTTKSDYSWSTYLDSPNRDGNSFTKYALDKKTQLDPEDDVAHVKWGGNWRMPTYAEQDELRTKCTWKWTTSGGINGYVVTGPNGNSVFLPAAGNRLDSSLGNVGSWGYYWSSSLYSGYSKDAYNLGFNSGSVNRNSNNRYYGPSVRPVCP